MARTIWALGEGYAAFAGSGDPVDAAFADFLQQRLELSVAAVDQDVLDTYGVTAPVDGRPTPTWLIADGADASSEAVLGLAAYVEAGGSDAAAHTALEQLADGIAMLSGGTARTWPFGAVFPWALSRSLWHAWGSQMPAALARASQALGTTTYLAPAVKDSAVFTPWMLTSGGPDNGRLPTRLDQSQIAYGADARVQSLLATADATGKTGLLRLAGMQAAWFFGANAAGVPAYDPSTGRTIDGISGDGVVNPNSGAESTIHGLLTMLALDAHPDVARAAQQATIVDRVGTTTLQAEDATTTGDARVVTPDPLWTGESLFGGSGYLALGAGATASLPVPRAAERPSGHPGGRPPAGQLGRHHLVGRTHPARPCRVRGHRRPGHLAGPRRPAPGDPAALDRRQGHHAPGHDNRIGRRRGPAGRRDARAAGLSSRPVG